MNAPLKEPVLLTPLDDFLPQVTEYTHKILFFHNAGHERDVIARQMRDAFAQVMDAIPWIAGSVTHIKHEHQKGRLAIAAPFNNVDDLLTVNDLDYLDYATLKAEHFPMQALIEEEVWPQRKWTDRPTLQAQINFIQGGMILTVRANHSVTDGHGLRMITNVWAAYCRGEDGSLLLGSDSHDRAPLMSGLPANIRDFRTYTELPSAKRLPEHGLSHQFSRMCDWVVTRIGISLLPALGLVSDLVTYRSISMVLRAKRTVDEGPRQAQIFFFSAARLREMKEALTATGYAESHTESKAWISTHDAVVSLLWCCITQTWKESSYFDRDLNTNPVRRLKLQIASGTTQPMSGLAFFLNGRRLIKDPPLKSYIGNVILINSFSVPFSDVGSTLHSVARNAYALRRKVLEYDVDYLMRLVGALGTVPDVTRMKVSHSPFSQSSMCIHSWAGMEYYSTNWGTEVGGRPERIRLSRFRLDPFCLVLPKLDAKDGWSEDECGLEVAVHLKGIFMQKLRQDELFNSFAEWRCS